MKNLEALQNQLHLFEEKINYSFKSKPNLLLALTHSSYANENKSDKLSSNERLEFLGDAVLNLTISRYIYTNYPTLSEGEMTKIRASIVCEHSLVICANRIHIGDFLLLGKGEELTGGRTRVSILSDAFEALIGAIYLDRGLESAGEFILYQMEKIIRDSLSGAVMMDYKTELQEIVQRNNELKIIYEIIEEKGPDHDKVFISQVKVDDIIFGTGSGRSKKEAEQCAAKHALEKMV